MPSPKAEECTDEGRSLIEDEKSAKWATERLRTSKQERRLEKMEENGRKWKKMAKVWKRKIEKKVKDGKEEEEKKRREES